MELTTSVGAVQYGNTPEEVRDRERQWRGPMADTQGSGLWDEVEKAGRSISDGVQMAPRKTYGGQSFWDKAGIGGSTGGFRFPDAETATKIIQRFEDRAEAMHSRQELIRGAIRALEDEFAADHSSNGWRAEALRSLERLRELNTSAQHYAAHYAAKITAARDGKEFNEEQWAATFTQTAKEQG